jgi:hypothetical protein
MIIKLVRKIMCNLPILILILKCILLNYLIEERAALYYEPESGFETPLLCTLIALSVFACVTPAQKLFHFGQLSQHCTKQAILASFLH